MTVIGPVPKAPVSASINVPDSTVVPPGLLPSDLSMTQVPVPCLMTDPALVINPVTALLRTSDPEPSRVRIVPGFVPRFKSPAIVPPVTNVAWFAKLAAVPGSVSRVTLPVMVPAFRKVRGPPFAMTAGFPASATIDAPELFVIEPPPSRSIPAVVPEIVPEFATVRG